MKDIQPGNDNYRNDFDNNKPKDPKKPNLLLDILMGMGISIATYALIWPVSMSRADVSMIALADFIFLVLFIYMSVKFLRSSHKAAAITMLIMITPCILTLMALGACSMMIHQRLI